jgi:hypothetical protein
MHEDIRTVFAIADSDLPNETHGARAATIEPADAWADHARV